MFREKALVKLKSPEQLDEALKIPPRKSLLALYAFIGVAVFGLLWGTLGRLPENGRGQGILITLNSVIPIQAQADGQIARWDVAVSDVIEKNQVLGILAQPEIERELGQAEAKLEEVLARNRTLHELRARYNQLEREAIVRKSEILQARIDYLNSYIERTGVFAEDINSKNVAYLDKQRANLLASKDAQQRLIAELGERYASYRRLRAENLTSRDNVDSRRRRFEDAKLKLDELELQIQELDLKGVELADTYLDTRNLIATRAHTLTQLTLQLRELDNQKTQLDKQESEDKFRDRNEVNELKRTIERHRKRLQRDREIKAEFAGRVLELTAAEGSVVTLGKRLLQLDIRVPSSKLVALAYFKDDVGKRLQPGMAVRVTPSTVSQKRYGNIKGEIVSVSEFPVTEEAATNYIGNTEVARKLLADKHQIEVIVRLALNASTPSGYAWTSLQGPDTSVTAGTTADVWITHERRPPLSYVPPVLREWTGL